MIREFNVFFSSVIIYFFNYINEKEFPLFLPASVLVSLSLFAIVFVDKMVVTVVTVAVRQHVAKSMTKMGNERGDAAIQVRVV